MKARKSILIILTINVAILIASISVLASVATRAMQALSPSQETSPRTLQLPDAIALLAGAIAVAGSTIASGIALRGVATAGFAAAAEKPELTTWMLIMGGLAEGIAVYGLLLGILILGKI